MKYLSVQQKADLRLIFGCIFTVIAIMVTVCWYIPPVADIDDTFAEYLLGNGFPAATTKVTYFEYSFLFYEQFFAWLYHCFPSVNVMTVFYLLLHGSCAITVSCILLRLSRAAALITLPVYLSLFLIPFIVHISYTGTAGHCIATTLLLCAAPVLQKKPPGLKALFTAFLLLMLGAGLRVHILLPLLAAAAPLLWLIKEKGTGRRLLLLALLTGSGIAGSILLHQRDYREKIDNWPQIRSIMDATFYLSNHGNLENPDGILKDNQATAFLPLAYTTFGCDHPDVYDSLVQQYKQHAVESRPLQEKKQSVYDLLLLSRKHLFLLFLIIFLLAVRTDIGREYKWIAVSSGLTGTGILLFMAYFLKAPERVSLPLLLVPFLICSALLGKAGNIQQSLKATIQAIVILLLAVQGMTFYKRRQEHIFLASRFIHNARFLQQHKETLFIELTSGSFPLDGFPALSSPAAYPLENICLGFFFNTELRSNTLRRFGYKNAWETIGRGKDNVMVIGRIDPALVHYIQQRGLLPVAFFPLGDLSSGLKVAAPRITPTFAY